LLALVADAGRTHDLVIVSAHWGPNWGRQPPVSHPPAARALVEAGADVVFGHSAHIVRGVEVYRHRPILYSCGDFIDDYAVDTLERNDQSCIALVDVDGGRPTRVTLVPTMITRCQARIARGQDGRMIVHRLRERCESLGTPVVATSDGLEIGLDGEPPRRTPRPVGSIAGAEAEV
jgi:poly-gamma-glutamate synthesis protein (capsule biosynthesis protein)